MARNSRPLALAAGAAVLAAGLVTTAIAQNHEGRRGFGPRGFGHGGFRGLAQLELTDAQREQVRDVRQRHEADLKEAASRLRMARDAQREAVGTLPVNEGLIRSTAQALAEAETEMAVLRARVHGEIWTLLTPEQQEKAKELKAQRETRMKERRERMKQRREQRQQG